MSLTFNLRARDNHLSVNFYPPIQLESEKNYALALIGFHAYNSIPNIEEGVNNKFHYETESGIKEISIPTGTYEIRDIENFLQQKMLTRTLDNEEPSVILTSEQNKENRDPSEILQLRPNNNLLKAEMKCVFDVDFTATDSVGRLLGFTPDIYKANTRHYSNIPVDIVKVITIRVECNIVSGSYYGDKQSHTLYEFTPSVDPGYLMSIEPKNLIYLPLLSTNKTIDNITIDIIDQDSNPVNFRGEEIVVRIELKNYGSYSSK